ncbi:MAG TPA: hypothetical protein VFG86_12395, partial [Chloroflexota bacterium]|nr:hypothetical protein [Chloroflexota bacterium]
NTPFLHWTVRKPGDATNATVGVSLANTGPDDRRIFWGDGRRHSACIRLGDATEREVGMATDRKLIVTENMTVDGVIDATEGWFSAAGADEGAIQPILLRLSGST